METEIAFVVLIVAVIVSRIISHKALQELTSDQKAALIDSFSGMQAYSLIPLALLLGLYFLLIRFTATSTSILLVGFFLVLICYIAWNYWFIRKKMSALDLPESYLSKNGIARVIQYAGLGVFLAITFASAF